MSRELTRYLALLRGINVGGKRLVPMPALARVVESCGCTDASTYIQSGNVLLSSPLREAPLMQKLEQAIEAEFGFAVPVVLRTRQQMAAVVAGNPFLAEGAPEKDLHVMFLRETPAAALVSSLDPQRSPGDSFRVVEGNIYLNLGTGVAKTKLNNQYFDSRLKTVATGRNWATVKQLSSMLG